MLLEEYSWFHGEEIATARTPEYNPAEWEGDEEDVEEIQYVAYGVVAPIIVSIGLFGNVLVILLLRLPQFKGVVFSFFNVLAVADLLSLGMCISPLYHVLHTATLHHSTAVWYSYFELLFVGAAMSTSVLTVVCITIYRFFSVCRPAEIKRLNTPRFPRLSVGIAIVTSIIAWFPASFIMQPETSEECATSSFTPPDNQTWWVACLRSNTRDKGFFIAYVWVRQVVVIFLPILLVVTLNLLTLRGFIRHRKTRRRILNPRANDQPSTLSKNKEERYLMGLLIAVMISFVITIVPSGIANAINISWYTNKMQFVIFSAVADNLEILNHALNFYLYILCSKQVREMLVEHYEKYRGSKTWSLESLCVWRKEKGRTDEGNEKREKGHSESPPDRQTKHIYVISCTPTHSESPHTDWHKENGQNEVLQSTYVHSVTTNDKSDTPAETKSHDNPNFNFNL